MDMLNTWWPVAVAALVVIVVVRRIRGEPLDLKDALASPAILLFLGARAIVAAEPTMIDLAWLAGLSLVSLLFGAARSATTIIEQRDGVFFQRYRWKTFGLMGASLVVGAGLGMLAQQFGLHEEAKPLTFTIGVGLAGEGAITLVRAAQRGAAMPWSSSSATNAISDTMPRR